MHLLSPLWLSFPLLFSITISGAIVGQKGATKEVEDVERMIAASLRFESIVESDVAALATLIRANPSNLTDLSRRLIVLRRDLATLVRSLNASEVELQGDICISCCFPFFPLKSLTIC